MKKKSGNRVFIVPSDDPRRVEGKATLDGKTVTDFNGPYQSFVSKELRDRAGINKKKIYIALNDRGDVFANEGYAAYADNRNVPYREKYKDLLRDARELGVDKEISDNTKKAIKDAIRKQAKKEAILKGSAIGLGVAGLGIAGVVSYKHYKNKKSKK